MQLAQHGDTNSVLTYFLRSSCSREEGAIIVAMEGEVEGIRVVIEDLLGPIPMVNVL